MIETCQHCRDYPAESAKWPDGPWRGEPSRDEWRHAGFACVIHRSGAGIWCGYVGVPPGHPAHGKGYDDDALAGVQVHGGLTYAQDCSGCVCHVPAPGEPDALWWVGFDCGHAGDAMPANLFREIGGESYKDVAFVKAETCRLAEQLAAMA
jgi:hypothetical protein